MDLTDFGYPVPEELIAQHPLKNRAKARLMVVNRQTKTITHDIFENVGHYLPPKSLLVLNQSKVIPARLLGIKESTGAQIEVFLLKPLNEAGTFETLLRPLKRLKNGDRILFSTGNSRSIFAEVIDRNNRTVRFNSKNIYRHLKTIGHMPLPPYIHRPDNALDKRLYQTVYAKNAGSVAAPTAGLHFSKALLNNLEKAGHKLERVTLHVNYATFKPVEEKDITLHKMHVEDYSVDQNTIQSIQIAKNQKRPVIAVGTTSCRVLETVAKSGKLNGSTDLFIYPGYSFQWVDGLITNFHLPFSTLLMLVYALGTKELMSKAYQEAVKQKYRFYSYGDGMLIF
jgi:S-adenosylmethionine:tRNA ribosyltransferase-isomerase